MGAYSYVYGEQQIRDALEEIAPDDGWYRSDTEDVLRQALESIPPDYWPEILNVVQAVRAEYGE